MPGLRGLGRLRVLWGSGGCRVESLGLKFEFLGSGLRALRVSGLRVQGSQFNVEHVGVVGLSADRCPSCPSSKTQLRVRAQRILVLGLHVAH